MPTLFTRYLKKHSHVKDREVARRSALRDTLDSLNDAVKRERSCPSTLRWYELALEMNVSLYTIQHWARQGRVPGGAALALERRFGTATVRAAELEGTEAAA